jgi:hypothetical protein
MWIEHILHPQIVRSIFKDEIPSLNQIWLHRMSLEFGSDPTCSLGFDLNQFPNPAPAKWLQREFNTVQISLRLINANLTMSIQGGAMIGDLKLNYMNQQFEIEFKNTDGKVCFNGTAQWIDVVSINAYQNSI